MRSRTIVSLTLLALVAFALLLIISGHGSEANSPATKVSKLSKRLALDNSIKASPAQSTQPLPSLQGKSASYYLKEHGLYDRLQNSIEAAQYQIDQQPESQESSSLRSRLRKNDAAEIYEATNPAQALRARFNGRDLVLQPLTDKRTTTLQARLRLRSYGYGRRMLSAGAGTMRVDGNRIEISRRLATQSNNSDQEGSDEIVEWYQNRKDGLEQGFTLAAAPGKRHAGTPLQVRLTVTGDVRPVLVDSGKALELIGGNGERWLRYDHLMATDAWGRQLPARFRADRKQISLLIDDTDAVYPLRIDPVFTQTKKLTASDAAANDRFGYLTAIDGDTVVVGASGKNSNTGAAYIFERNQGGAENWGQVKKLTASDAAVNDQFGNSVAIDVDRVVVGAWLKNSNTGAAYIFERNQGGVENWGQVKKLTASDAAVNASFGSSVSINADTVVVGANGSVPGAAYISVGAAYIFERNQGGTENWGQVQKLTASDPANYASFGSSVAINADTVVVGAYGKVPGRAYIFERNQGGDEHWGQVKELTASDAVGGDQFGISVAINIDTVAVGANHGHRATSGAVYIFERNQNGVESWGQVQELTASDAKLLDEFGISVAIDGDTLVVGAWARNIGTSGTTYICERHQNGVEGWGEVQRVTASDAAGGDQFGSSVGIDGDTAVVGAVGKSSNTGAAYIFDFTSTPTPSPTPNVSCGFTASLGNPPAPATTGTMTTRLLRGDAQGTCSTNPFPGNTDAGSYPFDAYTFTNSSSSTVCVSAALTKNSQSDANYQIAAFLAPFVATDIANPSRYLGDPGISSGTSEPLITSFQFTVPGNTSFAIVVFAVNGTAGLGGSYTFQVMSTSSFCPATPTATPTPPPTAGTAVAYQIDAAHTGAQFDTITPPLTQRWSRDLGGQISYPLIAGGRIFVTVANQASYGTKLYALDEANGATLWGPVDLGGTYGWSNAAYEAGRVFAVNFDGLLRAFDAASGALLWSKQLPGQYSFDSPPTASGGLVYVVGAGTGVTLYAVDEQDGAVIWSNLMFSGSDSSPAVTSTGVFVSFACNAVYDFSPQDGSLIWQHSEGCTGGGGSTPVFFGGRLYEGDSLTEKLMFDAPTGAVLGTFPAGPPPAFSGSTGFFLTGSILKARDAYSGAVRWTFTGDSTLISAPIVDNGYVYIGSSSGKVYALDASTGANVWTGNLGAAVQTTESLVSRPHTGIGAGDDLVVVPASTLLVAYQSQPGPPQLLLDESGPAPNQVAALDSVLLTRDPFPVVNGADLLNLGVDRNTRVVVFAMKLQLLQGETSSAVTVSLVDSNNHPYDIAAEDVRRVPNSLFTQVVFRLPDNISIGTCMIMLKAHGYTSNSGSIRIRT
jgi:outer membrane protein assembly factor BamB